MESSTYSSFHLPHYQQTSLHRLLRVEDVDCRRLHQTRKHRENWKTKISRSRRYHRHSKSQRGMNGSFALRIVHCVLSSESDPSDVSDGTESNSLFEERRLAYSSITVTCEPIVHQLKTWMTIVILSRLLKIRKTVSSFVENTNGATHDQ